MIAVQRVLNSIRHSIQLRRRVAFCLTAIVALPLAALLALQVAHARVGEAPAANEPAPSAAAVAPSAPAATAPGAKLAAPLRYGWKPKMSYAYRVSIEADRVDYVDVWAGTPWYSVTRREGDQAELALSGGLFNTRRSTGARPPFGPRGPAMAHGMLFSQMGAMRGMHGPMGLRQVTVDARGKVIRQQGDLQIGWALGDLSALTIEPLPERIEPSWKVAKEVTISRTKYDYTFPLMLTWRDNEEQFSANEEAAYTVQGVEGKRVKIKKRYELKSAATLNGKPRCELVGDGDLVFDTERGVFTEYSGSLTLSSRERNISIEIPLKVSYALVEAGESGKTAPPAAPKKVEPEKPITGSQLDQLAADLESGDVGRVLLATNRLGNQKPEAPNTRIAAALAKVLRDDQSSVVRANAARALQFWSTPESAPELIRALDDQAPPVRMYAMRALAKLCPEEASHLIAARLKEPIDRFGAVAALRTIGQAAEPAVIKQLASDNTAVRKEAVLLLKEIGTARSVDAIQKATEDSNADIQRLAKEALAKIKSRQ